MCVNFNLIFSSLYLHSAPPPVSLSTVSPELIVMMILVMFYAVVGYVCICVLHEIDMEIDMDEYPDPK